MLRKIWYGPGRCPLCKAGNESIDHVFISCSYRTKMWNHASQVCGIPFNWSSISLDEALAL